MQLILETDSLGVFHGGEPQEERSPMTSFSTGSKIKHAAQCPSHCKTMKLQCGKD